MHTVVITIAVALGAFMGTMLDNFAAFSAQLALTEPRRHERAMTAQVLGVLTLIIISAGVGSALAEIPLHWIGLLALAPLALAFHAWKNRHQPARTVKRGAITTFLVTIALGGDNLAVWIPLIRADGLHRAVLTAGIFLLSDVALVALARFIVNRPRVIDLSAKIAPRATPLLYVALSVVIVWQCHVF
jgi:cadmium resistance protein CadD (predicted permease)